MERIVITYVRDGKLRVQINTVDDSAVDEVLHLVNERTVL